MLFGDDGNRFVTECGHVRKEKWRLEMVRSSANGRRALAGGCSGRRARRVGGSLARKLIDVPEKDGSVEMNVAGRVVRAESRRGMFVGVMRLMLMATVLGGGGRMVGQNAVDVKPTPSAAA